MRKFQIVVNGNSYIVDVEELAAGQASAPVAAAPVSAAPKAAPAPAAAPAAAPKAAAAPAGAEAVKSPMPGTINAVNVTAGQAVKKGDILCILEAMKMENEILASRDGVVASVNVTKGATVASGDVLLTLN